MYFVFIIVVLLIVSGVLWCFLSYHNVLANRRFLNAGWGRIHALLMARNEMLAHFQENWAGVRTVSAQDVPAQEGVAQQEPSVAAPPSPLVIQFQDLLAEDVSHEWDDVVVRAEIRAELEEVAHKLFTETLSRPQILQDEDFNLLRVALEENTAALNVEVKGFNKIVTRYNFFLKKQPNPFMARHFGAVPIDIFPIQFAVY